MVYKAVQACSADAGPDQFLIQAHRYCPRSKLDMLCKTAASLMQALPSQLPELATGLSDSGQGCCSAGQLKLAAALWSAWCMCLCQQHHLPSRCLAVKYVLGLSWSCRCAAWPVPVKCHLQHMRPSFHEAGLRALGMTMDTSCIRWWVLTGSSCWLACVVAPTNNRPACLE